VYYILETCAYCISGSTELFPQNCQLPDMPPYQHLCALTNELSNLALPANATHKGKRLLCLLQTHVHALLHPPPVIPGEQRVDEPIDAHKAQQRIINNMPIITIPRITEAPGIMKSRNPAAKRTFKTTPRLQQHVTRNNTPGIVPIPPFVSTGRGQKVPPNSIRSTFTYLQAICHQFTHRIQDQKMPGHICATRFVKSRPFKDGNSNRVFCMPHGTSHHQRNNFKLQKTDEQSSDG
jgi:hypothetical protein